MLYWRHCFYDRCGLGQRSVCSIGTPPRSSHIHHHRHHHQRSFSTSYLLYGCHHFWEFIAISIAIPFLYRLEKLRGRGISGHWRIVSHCPTLFHHLSSFEPPPPPILLSPGVYNQPLTVFNEHTHTSYCNIRQISPS